MQVHPFDHALSLCALGGQGQYAGSTSPAYWNMVGPFGGITAAVALRSVLAHPLLLGEPVALTVNYASAIGAGDFEIAARPARTNRSTQHWTIEMRQRSCDGAESVVMTATAVTAMRRLTWSASEIALPAFDVSAAPRLHVAGSEWTQRYEMRALQGMIPMSWDGQQASGEDASLTRLWVRDEPPRPLDFLSLAAMCDVFYPRVWLRRATRVPAGTVSITTYFHAGQVQLTQTGSGFLLAQARAQTFSNGFFDQTAHVWNQAGQLLATSNQIVYYKE